MAPSDADRWNQRYADPERELELAPRPLLVEFAGLLPAGGLALEVAMGLGASAEYLLRRGLRVVGVDVSGVAVRRAKTRCPELMAVVADLGDFWLPARSFDVILNFYFLDRRLWADFRRILKPGGLLILETLTREMLTEKPDLDPAYLLEPGELPGLFPGWQILAAREGWTVSGRGRRKAIASLVARCPAG